MRRFIIILVPVSEPSGCGAILVLLLLIAFLCNGAWEWTGKTFGLIPPTPTMKPWPTDTPTPIPNWTSLANGGGATWSPDGKMIAYVYNNDVWITTASGVKQNLTASHTKRSYWNPTGPAWLPDNHHIIFFPSHDYTGSEWLGIVSTDTKEVLLFHPEWLGPRGVTMGWLGTTNDGKIIIETLKGIFLADINGNLIETAYLAPGGSFGSLPLDHSEVLPDNKLLLITNHESGDGVIIDLTNLQTQTVQFGSVRIHDGVKAFSHKGDKLAQSNKEGQVVITDLSTSQSCIIRTTSYPRISWSPDDSMLMLVHQTSGGWDNPIYNISIANVCMK